MHSRRGILKCLAVACLLSLCFFGHKSPRAVAAEKDPVAADEKTETPKRKRYLAMKTLGGRQFWGDVLFFRGWTIQKNVLTGHYRLLDGDDFRHASGSRAECEKKLAEVKSTQKLKPMSGKAVVLIHGVVRSSKSLSKMATRLTDEGYTAVSFDYPSTRVDITESSEYLHSVIDSLDGIEEINFVVHSMGGLVVRTYLKKHRDKRIKRLVMLGVPNKGAVIADQLRKNSLFRMIYGPAGQQLVSDPNGFIAKLPTPDFEFAVIAGGRDNIKGFNPLLPGDDDGTVSVTSARLPGAADYLLVSCIHSFLMGHGDAIDSTARFLRTGRLRKEGEPRPISLPPKKREP